MSLRLTMGKAETERMHFIEAWTWGDGSDSDSGRFARHDVGGRKREKRCVTSGAREKLPSASSPADAWRTRFGSRVSKPLVN